jgi:hypothetical protein
VRFVCAASGLSRYRKIDRRERNGSALCQNLHTSVDSIVCKKRCEDDWGDDPGEDDYDIDNDSDFWRRAAD